MNRSEKWMQQWKETREKGKLRYVLLKGILPSIVINSIGYFLGYKYYKNQFSLEFLYDPKFLSVYAISLIFFCTLGAFLGVIEWSHNEGKYTGHLIDLRRQNVLNNLNKNKGKE